MHALSQEEIESILKETRKLFDERNLARLYELVNDELDIDLEIHVILHRYLFS